MLDQRLFSTCPDEVKFEIMSFLDEPWSLVAVGSVCKTWNVALKKYDILWKKLFIKDFFWWDSDGSKSANLRPETTWKKLYQQFFLAGWKWDPLQKHPEISLEDETVAFQNSPSVHYKGLRANRGIENGVHYFEILIEKSQDPRQDMEFDGDWGIRLGIGIATSSFTVEKCNSGWNHKNGGIGYYSDGQMYAFGRSLTEVGARRRYYPGDRIGLRVDMERKTVTFFVNDEVVFKPIQGLDGRTVFPHLIITGCKNRISITTCVPPRRNHPSREHPSSEGPGGKQSFSFNDFSLEKMGWIDF